MSTEVPTLLNNHIIYHPQALLGLNHQFLHKVVAETASSLIAQLGHKDTMFSYSPETLGGFLLNGCASFTSDEEGRIVGFTKMDPWCVYPDGHVTHGADTNFADIHSGKATVLGYESGSLVVDEAHQHKGLATEMVLGLTESVKLHMPQAPIFAICNESNKQPQGVYHRLGWVNGYTPQALIDLIGTDVFGVEDWSAEIPVHIFVEQTSLISHT